MDALIEQKRGEIRENPEQESKAWLERLAEVDQERRGYLRLAAKGHMSEDELDETLTELEETRRMAEQELEAIGDRQTEIEQLEHDRNALLASWSEAVPRNLDHLTPQKRNALYLTLRLEITPREDGFEVTGPFCTSRPLPS
jgi:multidrug resistance efflux pump